MIRTYQNSLLLILIPTPLNSEKNSPSMNINDILYRYRPPIDSFFEWRDYRVMDEIQW